MSNITEAIQQANIGSKQPERQGDPEALAKGLFMLFHGWYGNLLLGRYATGDIDAKGKDRGTKSAMITWGAALSRFDSDIVRAAADRCEFDHPKFPPTLPEFTAICRAIQPRRRSADQVASIEMSGELRSRYSAQARSVVMAAYQSRLSSKAGTVEIPDGLAGLCQLVARASALAGGDEAEILLRLDRAPSAKAKDVACN
jgi:hypothetical protein